MHDGKSHGVHMYTTSKKHRDCTSPHEHKKCFMTFFEVEPSGLS